MAELFDIVVRRQIYIEGLKASKGNEFDSLLNRLRTELSVRLAAFQYEDLGNATRTALKALIVDLRKIAKGVFDPYLSSLIEWLQRFVKIDMTMLASLYGQNSTRGDLKDELPTEQSMWALATGFPMAATGTLALPFLMALLPSLYVKLERVTMQHFATNSTKNELINAIVGTPSVLTNASAIVGAKGLLRQLQQQTNAATNTVIQHMSNQVNQALGALIFDNYQWISVIDDATTKICFSRNGNVYQYGKGPLPPAHVGCRSTTAPWIEGKDKPPRNFGEWIRGQSEEFVTDALDGRRTVIYEKSPPLTLIQYGRKSPLIGA